MKFGFDPDHTGYFWCVGQGGMGIQTAPAASLLCASLIRGDDLPDELTSVGAEEFAPRSTRS
jgi:D-arginine dehydrogenase